MRNFMKELLFAWIAILIFLNFSACHKTHRRLLTSKIAFVASSDDEDLGNKKLYPLLNDTTDTVKYENNRIYVSCVSVLTGCAKYRSDIAVVADTIFLLNEMIPGESCTEQNFYRTTYVIENNENKRYVFVKRD